MVVSVRWLVMRGLDYCIFPITLLASAIGPCQIGEYPSMPVKDCTVTAQRDGNGHFF